MTTLLTRFTASYRCHLLHVFYVSLVAKMEEAVKESLKLSPSQLAALGCEPNGDYNVAQATATVEDYRRKLGNKGELWPSLRSGDYEASCVKPRRADIVRESGNCDE